MAPFPFKETPPSAFAPLPTWGRPFEDDEVGRFLSARVPSPSSPPPSSSSSISRALRPCGGCLLPLEAWDVSRCTHPPSVWELAESSLSSTKLDAHEKRIDACSSGRQQRSVACIASRLPGRESSKSSSVSLLDLACGRAWGTSDDSLGICGECRSWCLPLITPVTFNSSLRDLLGGPQEETVRKRDVGTGRSCPFPSASSISSSFSSGAAFSSSAENWAKSDPREENPAKSPTYRILLSFRKTTWSHRGRRSSLCVTKITQRSFSRPKMHCSKMWRATLESTAARTSSRTVRSARAYTARARATRAF
mmetsp:Transcript_41206/g.81259  ORF Transcript_41206/g.81259 Transcript_41206/m.81259 type:complete len:308 (-) Transcript_41206:857-1780(-)